MHFFSFYSEFSAYDKLIVVEAGALHMILNNKNVH